MMDLTGDLTGKLYQKIWDKCIWRDWDKKRSNEGPKNTKWKKELLRDPRLLSENKKYHRLEISKN
jgi:hypothetical protein